MSHWTADAVPDQSGRRFVVTGANSGLGLQTVLALAAHGADVVMTSRDAARGDAALARVRAAVPGASVTVESLDLADLSSVRAAAARIGAAPVDVLVNNAGVMAIPQRTLSADGFEMQLATNHLGHFALTGLLLPALLERPGARVVTVSSGAHRAGRLDLTDLQRERSYSAWQVYGTTKLANLLFMRELQRRADAAGVDLTSVAAHPGVAATNLVAAGPAQGRRLVGTVMRVFLPLVSQSDAKGALPQLYAATMPDVRGGDYFGPDGMGEQRGYPKRVGMVVAARDDVAAEGLWDASVELTGVGYAELGPA